MKMCSFTFNSDMKLFLFRVLFFLLTIIFIFFCINIFQSRYNNSPSHFKLQYEAVNSNSTFFNGIIIGSSHSAHSIRPSLLKDSDISFYNLALNGSNPKFYYNWYNELFLERHKNLKYCLIGIDWFMFDPKWLWREFEQDSEYFTSDLFFKLLFTFDGFNKRDLIMNRFPFLKYRQNIRASIQMHNGNSVYPKNTYDKGYITYQPLFDSTKYFVTPVVNIDISQVNYFKKLITQMISNGVEIIFIMTPEYNIPPEYYTKMKSLLIINEISKQFNIPILNFNTDLRSYINEDIIYFSDFGHMNDKGSRVFSKYLSQELNRVKKARSLNNGYIQLQP